MLAEFQVGGSPKTTSALAGRARSVKLLESSSKAMPRGACCSFRNSNERLTSPSAAFYAIFMTPRDLISAYGNSPPRFLAFSLICAFVARKSRRYQSRRFNSALISPLISLCNPRAHSGFRGLLTNPEYGVCASSCCTCHARVAMRSQLCRLLHLASILGAWFSQIVAILVSIQANVFR